MAADCLAKGREYGVVWQLDTEVSCCPTCKAAFTLIARRHHCRHCGRIFCAKCTEYDLEHPITKKLERACSACVERAAGPGAVPPASTTPSAGGEGALYGVPWKPDAEAVACGCCMTPFNTTNRKHHCRFCGDVVCLKCSVNQLMHPRTNRPEKACVTCVKNFQLKEAVERWRHSPSTMLRAASASLATFLLLLALVTGAGAAAFLSLITAPELWGLLYLQYRQVSSGMTMDEFIVQYYSDASHVHLVKFVLDAVLSCLALIVIIASLAGKYVLASLVLFLLTGTLGGCTWFSYYEALPAMRHVWTQLRNTDEDNGGNP